MNAHRKLEARQGQNATARVVHVASRTATCTPANCMGTCQETNSDTQPVTMAEEQAAHHLLNVVEERGLNVDLDKILLSFEDGDTNHELAAWVEEYLHEETLLTKEELELYVWGFRMSKSC